MAIRTNGDHLLAITGGPSLADVRLAPDTNRDAFGCRRATPRQRGENLGFRPMADPLAL
jgi:hypothetical protein